MKVAVLVPLGSLNTARRDAWSYVARHYGEHHPEYELVVGRCEERPWRKGVALAQARAHTDAEILVVADADVLCPPARLAEAVLAVRDSIVGGTGAWVIPYREVRRLTERATRSLYDGRYTPDDLERATYTGTLGGGLLALPAALYDDVSGVDPRFAGWGGEDEALGLALRCLHGPPAQLAGELVHLWHPHAYRPARAPETIESRRLLDRYRAARRSPKAMRALLS